MYRRSFIYKCILGTVNFQRLNTERCFETVKKSWSSKDMKRPIYWEFIKALIPEKKGKEKSHMTDHQRQLVKGKNNVQCYIINNFSNAITSFKVPDILV